MEKHIANGMIIVTEDKKSCAARIYDAMQSREETIDELWTKAFEDCDDEASEELWNLALDITSKKVIRIDLSTGGPADWIEVWCDDYGISEMVYHFSDWFDHAERKISDSSMLWTWAESLIDNNL